MINSKTYYESPIGTLSISSTDNCITEILFVDSMKGRKNSGINHQEMPSPDKIINQCKIELDEYFRGERKRFEIKIKQEGTFFQHSVWNELLNIPYGRSISYMQLSKRIGNAKAIRAVGTTNGSNKICIAVPCHRVIGSNGSLVGYGGDLWRKKWLLDHEAKYENGVKLLFE